MNKAIFSLITGLLLCGLTGCSGPGVLDGDASDANDSAVADSLAFDTVTGISVRSAQNMYVADSVKPVIVTGYIVGTVQGTYSKGCDLTPPFTVETNLLLADTTNPSSIYDCMPVELQKDTRIRKKLNLVDNPHMCGRKVVIRGYLRKYFRVAGLKSTNRFRICE